ncbi:MAG: hypothetical protein ACTTGZ_04705 [Treponema sp.]
MSNGAFYFYSAFQDCEKLTAGSIKVPAGQLEAYKDYGSTGRQVRRGVTITAKK